MTPLDALEAIPNLTSVQLADTEQTQGGVQDRRPHVRGLQLLETDRREDVRRLDEIAEAKAAVADCIRRLRETEGVEFMLLYHVAGTSTCDGGCSDGQDADENVAQAAEWLAEEFRCLVLAHWG